MKQNRHYSGLTDAQVLESRKKHGANVLTPPAEETMWEKIKNCMHFWLLKVDLAIVVIATLAAKSYKIAQAMAKEAYGSRQNDKKSSEASGTDYVNVNKTSLQTNTERILYNLNESIKTNIDVLKDTKNVLDNINESVKANTNVLKDTGIKFNGTPDVNISNTPNVNINNSPSVTVSNMPSEPIEVTGDVTVSGKVGVTGTVSVDNFPQSSNSNSNSNS